MKYLILLSLILAGCSGTFNNGASIYSGIDYTDRNSPQCQPGGNDRATSNMGLRYYAYESKDGKTTVNGKYTHHSCVFNPDVNGYDAVGFEIEHKLW